MYKTGISNGEGLVDDLINRLPFEFYIPGYQFCEPGTRLQKRLARNDKMGPLGSTSRTRNLKVARHVCVVKEN